MPNYTLELELFSLLNDITSDFEIWADGVQFGGGYSVSSSGTSISVSIPYGGALPTSLEFRFDDAAPGSMDQIEIRAVKINDKYVNTGNYLSSNVLNDGGSATVDIINSDFIFDPSEPAASVFTTGATRTLTAGNDTLRTFLSNDPERFDALAGHDRIYLGGGVDEVNGNDGNDIIYGGGGNDLLYGEDGNDRLYGDDGDDLIYGGNGDDRVQGDAGHDEIHGGAGNDRLNGHDGNDIITGGTGNDNLNGGTGNDYLFGGDDNDQLTGGAGDDTLDGGNGDDLVYGGAGVDHINGGDGNDTLIGNNGDDIISGDDGDDIIHGMDDNDTLHGGNGNDQIFGGNGNDVVNGGDNNDIIVGGDGIDTLNGDNGDDILHGSGLTGQEIYTILQANPSVTFNAETNSFYQYVSSNVTQTAALAAAQATMLGGVAGHLVNITSQVENDYIANLVTADVWIGGSDEITEGRWLWQGGAEEGLNFYNGAVGGSSPGGNYQNWNGGEPNDFATGEDYVEFIDSNGRWNDNGGPSNGATTNHYVIEWDAGLISDDLAIDTLSGGAGNDFLYGYGGDDILSGGDDDDILFGGGDDDRLTGDSGDDGLYGQDGNDVMIGAAGISPLIDATTLLSYAGGQDGTTTITYFPGGVTLDGNPWKKVLINYTVTANTVIEFDFLSTLEGDIHGIGFDNDDNIDNDTNKFKVYGTQAWNRDHDDFNNYDGSGDWNHYTIDVGSFFTGTFSHLTIIGDDDSNPRGNGTFANFIIYEDTGATDDDIIDGGDGDDQLLGGNGVDTLHGGGGDDVLSGNAGDDVLNGHDDDDNLYGGNGADILHGGTGNDNLYGGDGADTLYGNSTQVAIGQAGQVTTNQTGSGQWHTVTFDALISNPVIKMSMNTENDTDPITLRVRNVTDSGFEWQIDEWDYLDGIHGSETVSWLAIATGTHTLDDGTVIQAGTVTASQTSGTGPNTNVTFNSAFGSAPVIMSQVMTTNEASAVTVHNENRTTTGFTLHLEEEEGADLNHASETVGWIAIDNGGSVANGLLVGETGNSVTHNTTTVNYGSSFAANSPVVLLDLQTEDGGDTAVARGSATTASSVSFSVEEEQSANAEVNHTTEIVGYYALTAGVIYEDSDNGADTLAGGAGLDILYGGDGADTFIFYATSAFADTDEIMDFKYTQGDVLDISDIITGAFSGTITDYVQFVDSGTDTLVQVDANGLTGGSSYSTIASLEGVTGLDEAALYANGNIVV